MKTTKTHIVFLAGAVAALALLSAANAQEYIVDNDQGSPAYVETGTWTTSGSTGYNGGTYRYATVGGAHTATWTANLASSGDYIVSVIYRAGTNRATSTKYTVSTAAGPQTLYVNQQTNDLVWVTLGTWAMNAGNATIVLDAAGSSGGSVVIADAVRFVLDAGPTPTPTPSPTPQTNEFRAFWVDAWGSGFKTAAEVTALVNTVKDHNYNAIVAQVRKRGDAYYFPTAPNTEPRATDIASNFDPLQELINQAHPYGIEVHAWVVVNLIEDTTINASPNHVYNAHPEYLMKDSSGATYIGEGYFLDPGNPDANKWNYNVVMDLVSHYAIDGIHYDYIRYPTDDSGYNDVAIARYNEEYSLTGQPSYSDPTFKAWRRRQITDWVRATYADIIAVKPAMKVSAAVFASESDAYNYRFQDWPTWMTQHSIDLLCPMNYTDVNSTYNSRADNANAKKSGRHCAMGQGAYLNTLANSATQMLYARSIGCEGVLTYSYRATNNENASNAAFYDYVLANVFQQTAGIPPMPWKTNPTGGYLRGTVTDYASGEPIYNATITVVELAKSAKTDGEGKYAILDFAPGTYTIRCEAWGYATQDNTGVAVAAGAVATSNFSLGGAPTPTPSPTPTPAVDIIVDNDDGSPAYTETGTWTTSTYPGYNGGTYRYATAGGANTATWKANVEAGDYELSVIYVAGANRATAAKYVVSTASGNQTVYVDQTQNSLVWVLLGTFTLNAGENTIKLDASGSTPASTVVIADAVHFLKVGSATPTPSPTPSLTPSPSPTASPTPTLTPSPSPTPPPTPIHVDSITMAKFKNGKNNYAKATVLVKDNAGNPVSGATVSGTWSGRVSGTSSGTTGADGTVTLQSPNTKTAGTITFCVDNITADGYTYDPGANVETCDSIAVP